MRTLQEKYNGVNEGAFSKDQFLRDARLQLPNLVTRFNGYDDAVQILKNRGMIQEEKSEMSTAELMDMLDKMPARQLAKDIYQGLSKDATEVLKKVAVKGKEALGKALMKFGYIESGDLKEARITNKSLPDYRYKVTNDMDKYPYEQILRGLRVELEGLQVTGTPTAEEYKKALAKVLKNLEKDEIYYTNQVAGISKKVDLHDKMVDVKKDNAVDTFNGLKKAQLKEGFKKLIKNILKENSEISGLYDDEEKYEREEKYGSYEEKDVYEMYGDSDGDYEHDKASGAEADRLYDAGYIYFLKGEGKKAEALRQEALKKGSWLGWGELEFPPYTTKDGSDVADDIRHPAGHLNHDDTISESDENDDAKLARYRKYTYTLDGKEVSPKIAYFNNYIGADLGDKVYTLGSPDEKGVVALEPRTGKTGMYTENTFETVSLKDIL